MKRSIAVVAILAIIGFSCRNSVDPEKLRESVLSSREFAAFAEAYKNRGADLMAEKQEEGRKLQEELEKLPPEERKARREKVEEERKAEAQKEQEKQKLMGERNRRVSALLKSDKKLTKEEFGEAVSRIDEELGINPEVATPARTRRMKEAMAALLEKFPEIREQGADFLKDCLEAYKRQ